GGDHACNGQADLFSDRHGHSNHLSAGGFGSFRGRKGTAPSRSRLINKEPSAQASVVLHRHSQSRSLYFSPVRCRKRGSRASNSCPLKCNFPSLARTDTSPCQTRFPGLVMMATSWHTRSTASSTWVVMKTVRPCSVKRRSHCF